MKTEKNKADENEVKETYPISNVVEGWFFRIKEISNGGYEVEGTDLFGRKVSRMDNNPDILLQQCAEDAKSIKKQLKKAT